MEEGVATEEVAMLGERRGALVDEVPRVPARRQEPRGPLAERLLPRRLLPRRKAADEGGEQGVPVVDAADERRAEELPQGRTPELSAGPPAGGGGRGEQGLPPHADQRA